MSRYLNNLPESEDFGEQPSGADYSICLKMYFDDVEKELDECEIFFNIVDEDGRDVYKNLKSTGSLKSTLLIPYTVTETLNGRYAIKLFVDGFNTRSVFYLLMEVR